MAVIEVRKNVLAVGTDHPEREVFDELVPLSEGTSYNSYIVEGGEKTALIDTNEPEMEKEYLSNLKEAGKNIDYVIANHAEQDHSGLLPNVLEMYPNAKVITNEKCKGFLIDLLHIKEERFQTIEDGEELDLGGKTLRFLLTPWTHWPETMVTYLVEDRILFSCDLFGSHYACGSTYAKNDEKLYEMAKVYYAEIMMPFRKIIQRHLEKIDKMEIDMICPSHGPIYDKPEFILEAYSDWTSDEVKNMAIVAYVSMHGSTKIMAERLANSLKEKGVGVKLLDLGKSPTDEMAISLVDAATVLIGSPAVLVGPHPSAIYGAYLFKILRPKTKNAGIFGSYEWGAQVETQLQAILEDSQSGLLEPVMIKGLPKEEDLKGLDKLAEEIAKRHQDLK